MHYLKKKDPEEWLSLEEEAIDKIIKEMDELPGLNTLMDQINEFKTGLRVLKDKKTKPKTKKTVAETVHLRADQLHKTFSALQKKFKELSQEAEAVEKMDDYIRKNWLLVYTKNPSGEDFSFHASKDEHFYLGRENIHGSLQSVSRKHLELFVLDNKLYIKQVGKFRSLYRKTATEKTYHPLAKLMVSFPMKEWIEIKVVDDHNNEIPGFLFFVTEVEK